MSTEVSNSVISLRISSSISFVKLSSNRLPKASGAPVAFPLLTSAGTLDGGSAPFGGGATN